MRGYTIPPSIRLRNKQAKQAKGEKGPTQQIFRGWLLELEGGGYASTSGGEGLHFDSDLRGAVIYENAEELTDAIYQALLRVLSIDASLNIEAAYMTPGNKTITKPVTKAYVLRNGCLLGYLPGEGLTEVLKERYAEEFSVSDAIRFIREEDIGKAEYTIEPIEPKG